MDKNLERIERYLQGIDVPEHASELHRQQLRRRILGKVGERRTGPARHIGWKIPAVAAGLICIAGVVAGVVERKHFGAGSPIGENPVYVHTANAADTNSLATVQPAANEAQQVDGLSQKDSVELVQVIESEVNGQLVDRTLVQKCMLSNGQTKPSTRGQQTPASLPAAAWQELGQLRQAGKGVNLGTQERRMKGLVFVFKRERYTLHDGTTVTLSVGEPKDKKQPLPDAPTGNYR
jgi:hypothetical protein